MTQGGFNFHPIWTNLPKFVKELDVEAVKRKLWRTAVRSSFRSGPETRTCADPDVPPLPSNVVNAGLTPTFRSRRYQRGVTRLRRRLLPPCLGGIAAATVRPKRRSAGPVKIGGPFVAKLPQQVGSQPAVAKGLAVNADHRGESRGSIS